MSAALLRPIAGRSVFDAGPRHPELDRLRQRAFDRLLARELIRPRRDTGTGRMRVVDFWEADQDPALAEVFARFVAATCPDEAACIAVIERVASGLGAMARAYVPLPVLYIRPGEEPADQERSGPPSLATQVRTLVCDGRASSPVFLVDDSIRSGVTLRNARDRLGRLGITPCGACVLFRHDLDAETDERECAHLFRDSELLAGRDSGDAATDQGHGRAPNAATGSFVLPER